MLVAAGVVPHPPVLVPELAGAPDDGLDALRAACDATVVALLDARPETVVVLAAGEPGVPQGTGAAGTLAPYGLPGWTCGGDGLLDGTLGLGHTIGAWLLDRAGWHGPRRYDLGDGSPVDLPTGRVALLVAADGSARRSTGAPGYLDPRAAPFDQGLADALRTGDADALARLDLGLADDLWAHGAAALRSLGATVRGLPTHDDAATAVGWESRLDHDAAPFGVGYLCATWRSRAG